MPDLALAILGSYFVTLLRVDGDTWVAMAPPLPYLRLIGLQKHWRIAIGW